MCFCEHSLANCDKPDWKPCGRGGCDQRHSWLLHEAVQEAVVATTYKTDTIPSDSTEFWVQKVDVLDHDGEPCSAVAMWDGGANMNLIKRTFAEKMKLEYTSHQTMIKKAIDGIQVTTQNVSFKLLDRNGNIHMMQAAVVDAVVQTKVKTLEPDVAAKMFNRDPSEFDEINDDVDILLGTVRISIVPDGVATVNETRLYGSIFGTGLFCVSTSDGATTDYRVVCRAVKIEPKVEDWFTTESLGIGPQPLCSGCSGCKVCASLQNGATYLEMQQLKLIEKNLSLDLNTRRSSYAA